MFIGLPSVNRPTPRTYGGGGVGPPLASGLPAEGGIIAGPGPRGELRSRVFIEIGPPPDGDGSRG